MTRPECFRKSGHEEGQAERLELLNGGRAGGGGWVLMDVRGEGAMDPECRPGSGDWGVRGSV